MIPGPPWPALGSPGARGGDGTGDGCGEAPGAAASRRRLGWTEGRRRRRSGRGLRHGDGFENAHAGRGLPFERHARRHGPGFELQRSGRRLADRHRRDGRQRGHSLGASARREAEDGADGRERPLLLHQTLSRRRSPRDRLGHLLEGALARGPQDLDVDHRKARSVRGRAWRYQGDLDVVPPLGHAHVAHGLGRAPQGRQGVAPLAAGPRRGRDEDHDRPGDDSPIGPWLFPRSSENETRQVLALR